MNKIILAILITLFLIQVSSAAPDFFTSDIIDTNQSHGFITNAPNTHYVVSTGGMATMATMPKKLDWRDQGVISPIKDQGECGGCYGFASVSSLESVIAINTGILPDLSENQAIKQNWEGLNTNDTGGCNGGYAEMVQNIWTTTGTTLEIDDTFTTDGTYNLDAIPAYRVNDWKLISTDKIPRTSILKQYVQRYGPIYTTLNGTQLYHADKDYDGTYALYSGDETTSTDHAVTIIGWDDNMGNGSWIVKNSWGAEWGEKGYGYVEYGSYGIGFFSSVVSGVETHDKEITTLNHDDAGWNGVIGAAGFDQIKQLVAFPVTSNDTVQAFEFWTTGTTSDVDLYLYSEYKGGKLKGELYRIEDLSFISPGFHSVNLDVPTSSNTSMIYAVANIKNLDCVSFNDGRIAPVATDTNGPSHSKTSYVAIGDDTSEWYDQWYDLSNLKMADGGIRGADATLRLRMNNDSVHSGHVTPNSPDYVTDGDLHARVNEILRQLNEFDNESVSSYEQILEILNNGTIKGQDTTSESIPDDYITTDEFNDMMTSIETRIAEMRVNSRSWIQRIFDKLAELFD